MDSVIVDLDGTLSDNSHRKHYIEGDDPDWSRYYGKVSEDGVKQNVRDFVTELEEDHDIIILTARSNEVRRDTIKWLEEHEIPFDKLIMLTEGRWDISDHKFKKEKLQEIEDPVLAIDDKTSNCKMFENHGLKTYTVENEEAVRFHS